MLQKLTPETESKTDRNGALILNSLCLHPRGWQGIGAGFGIGKIGSSAMEAIARQPEAAGDIRSNMIVIAALIEGVALFAVIVSALAIFIK